MHKKKKEELKKKESKGIIGKFRRKYKTKLLKNEITKRMKECIGKINPELEENIEGILEELEKQKESKNKLKAVNWKEVFSNKKAPKNSQMQEEFKTEISPLKKN